MSKDNKSIKYHHDRLNVIHPDTLTYEILAQVLRYFIMKDDFNSIFWVLNTLFFHKNWQSGTKYKVYLTHKIFTLKYFSRIHAIV